jgi:hypothetical protein
LYGGYNRVLAPEGRLHSMPKQFLCKLGIAQISANPAYADELVASIHEPTFPDEDQKVGLFTVAGIEEVAALRRHIALQHTVHLTRKIEAIATFAAREGVEILIFPEYAVPPEALPRCQGLSNDLRLIIVAGSHVVTASASAQEAYRELNLQPASDGSSIDDQSVRQAISVVFCPSRPPIAFTKYARSKWEGALAAGAPSLHAFEVLLKNGKLEVQVLICIEAIHRQAGCEGKTLGYSARGDSSVHAVNRRLRRSGQAISPRRQVHCVC